MFDNRPNEQNQTNNEKEKKTLCVIEKEHKLEKKKQTKRGSDSNEYIHKKKGVAYGKWRSCAA